MYKSVIITHGNISPYAPFTAEAAGFTVFQNGNALHISKNVPPRVSIGIHTPPRSPAPQMNTEESGPAALSDFARVPINSPHAI